MVYDITNVLSGSPVANGKRSHGNVSKCILLSYAHHSFQRQFSGRITSSGFAKDWCLSFLHRIDVVLFPGSEPKVGRIYAGFIVTIRAIVKYAHSFWDWAIVKYPRSCMRGNCSFMMSSPNNTVSVRRMLSFGIPKPARFSLFDFFPETFSEGYRKALRQCCIILNFRSTHNSKYHFDLWSAPRRRQPPGAPSIFTIAASEASTL